MSAEAPLQLADQASADRRIRLRRGAMTLVEVMVVGTLITIVAGVAVTLLAAVKRLDVRLRDHGVRTDQALRLAESIRGDIRRGTDVSIPTVDLLVVEIGDGERASYALQPGGCRRVVQGGSGAAPTADLFAIGTASAWKFDQDTAGRRPLVMVELQRGAPTGAETRGMPVIAYGELGADRARQVKSP
jgi:type II secretory pathway pseudopilin PulG